MLVSLSWATCVSVQELAPAPATGAGVRAVCTTARCLYTAARGGAARGRNIDPDGGELLPVPQRRRDTIAAPATAAISSL